MLKNLTMKKQKLLKENIENRLNQCNRSDYIHQEWELKKQKKNEHALHKSEQKIRARKKRAKKLRHFIRSSEFSHDVLAQ